MLRGQAAKEWAALSHMHGSCVLALCAWQQTQAHATFWPAEATLGNAGPSALGTTACVQSLGPRHAGTIPIERELACATCL